MQDLEDILIVGTGAAGAAAALACSKHRLKVKVIDIGESQKDTYDTKVPYYEKKRSSDLTELLLGANYWGLQAALSEPEAPFKLNMPLLSHVRVPNRRVGLLVEQGQVISTNALGGLANAWSCGLYEFNDDDLAEFPIEARDLIPYYSELSREAGIVGASDRLGPYFGPRFSRNFGALSRKCEYLLSKYLLHADLLENEHGFLLGHSRVGLWKSNPQDLGGYELLANNDIYVPRRTIERLQRSKKIRLETGLQVLQFRRRGPGVELTCLEARTGKSRTLRARKVLLGAGCLNTARIVLQSLQMHNVPVPVLDNPTFRIPLVLPRFLGAALEERTFNLVQLNCIWNAEWRMQGTIIELNGLRRVDVMRSFPLPFPEARQFTRHLTPSLLAMQLYLPAGAHDHATVSVNKDGKLVFSGPKTLPATSKIKGFTRILRKLGALTHDVLIKPLPYGGAVHYSGSFPMRADPAPLQCYADGSLVGVPEIHIIDSSNFSSLPAKNNSLTIMANSMRISTTVCRRLLTGTK